MGQATNSFGVLSSGFYEIQVDTGKIYVLLNQGVPSRGAHVNVEGTVMGQAVGVAIRESKHKVK